MIATCHARAHDDYCATLPAELERFAAAIARADPAARVLTCPEWTIADLAIHAGGVHRWAAEHVRTLSPVRIPGSTIDMGVPDDHAKLPEWLRDGASILVEQLRACDPDASVWAWGADKHARFWARRMTHETTIHRADAELTIGVEPAIDEVVSVDGVDEFLDNLPHASYFAPVVDELRGTGERIALRTPAARWTITLEPDRFSWSHEHGDATGTVAGSEADLYLFAWGRRKPGDLTVAGDRALIDHWVRHSQL